MKIALSGYGKMGKEIEPIARERNHEIALKITSSNKNDLTKENLTGIDAVIEFSRPDVVINNIRICLKAGIPIVVGTTGWYEHLDEIKSLCSVEKGSLIYASNFSIGVNLFFELNTYLASIISSYPTYEVQMEEIHHTQKLDKPSGTAITLANDILKKIKQKTSWTLSEQKTNPEQLAIKSVRKDSIVGTHMVKYSSDIDEIEIKHTANNRKGFASGAVIAAEWIVNRKGIYEMRDLIKDL